MFFGFGGFWGASACFLGCFRVLFGLYVGLLVGFGHFLGFLVFSVFLCCFVGFVLLAFVALLGFGFVLTSGHLFVIVWFGFVFLTCGLGVLLWVCCASMLGLCECGFDL